VRAQDGQNGRSGRVCLVSSWITETPASLQARQSIFAWNYPSWPPVCSVTTTELHGAPHPILKTLSSPRLRPLIIVQRPATNSAASCPCLCTSADGRELPCVLLSNTGSLSRPCLHVCSKQQGAAAPAAEQHRQPPPPACVRAANSRELPHALLSNTGSLTPVASMTPNVGGFAGPRLLAAQQRQYQQQRAMTVSAMVARSKSGSATQWEGSAH